MLPSAGTYGYEPNVDYFFGMPRSIKRGGVSVDMVRVSIAAGTNESTAESNFTYVIQLGAISSFLEHAILDQLIRNPVGSGESISAVKALKIANEQGQKIYHITGANISDTLANISHDSAVLDEITTAVGVGLEVITHESDLTLPGWSGAGYIILDPETGAAAYKIGGGTNGGWIFWVVVGFAIFAMLFLLTGGMLGATLAVLLFIEFAHFLDAIRELARSNISDEKFAEEANKRLALLATSAFAAILPIWKAAGGVGRILETYLAIFILTFSLTV